MSDLIERIEIELERGQTEGWKDPGEAAAAFEPLLREALSELKGMRKAMFDAGMQCGELIVKTGKKLKECQPCVEFYIATQSFGPGQLGDFLKLLEEIEKI